MRKSSSSLTVSLSVFCFFAFATGGYAQFQRQYGTALDESFSKVIPSGTNYYVLGQGEITDGQPARATVSRLNAAGELQWTLSLNIASVWNDAVLTPSGNLLVVGNSLPNDNTSRGIMGLVTASGAFTWVRGYDLPQRDGFWRIVRNAAPQNPAFPYYVLGSQTDAMTSNTDMFLLNLNESGTLNWKKLYFGPIFFNGSKIPRDLEALPNGDLLIAVNLEGQGLIMRTDNGGQPFNGVTPDGGFVFEDIALGAGGSVYAVGTGLQNSQQYVMKFDADLLGLWEVILEGMTEIHQVLPAGEVYVMAKKGFKECANRIMETGGAPTLDWVKFLDNGFSTTTPAALALNASGQLVLADGRTPVSGGFGQLCAFISVSGPDLDPCFTSDDASAVLPGNLIYNGPQLPDADFYDVPPSANLTGSLRAWQQAAACGPPCEASISVNYVDNCGHVQLTAVGSGLQPFSYQWCSGESTATIDRILPCGPHDFCVSVTCADGTVASASTTVVVSDNIPPTITCPQDMTVSAFAPDCDVAVHGIHHLGATDNCGIPTVDYAISGATTAAGQGDASGNIFGPGTSTVTYTATDWCNNTTSCSFDVTVQCDTCACLGFSGLEFDNLPGLPNIAVTCNATSVDLPCIGRDAVYWFQWQLNCSDPLCMQSTSYVIVPAAGGPPVLSGSIPLGSPPFLNFSYNQLGGAGNYQLILTGTCGTDSCTCVINFSVPECCNCGGFSDMTWRPTQGGFTQFVACGDTLGVICDQTFFPQVAGMFQCVGTQCPSTQTIQWVLQDPSGNPIQSGPLTFQANFLLALDPAWFVQPGIYTLTFNGNCGGQMCPPCVLYLESEGCFRGFKCGQAIVTCFSGFNQPSDYSFGVNQNGMVVALIDIRDQSSAIPGTWWANVNKYSHPLWTAQNMGQVFGIAIDINDDVFVAASSIYTCETFAPNPYNYNPFTTSGGPGAIYEIDNTTGVPTLFIGTGPFIAGGNTLPNNGSGLGNICYDSDNDQFFVSNHADGMIYRIKNGLTMSRFDPFGSVNPAAGGPGSNPSFVALGERTWGVGYHRGRVYFARWAEDIGRHSPASGDNEIWSVGLDGSGEFIAPQFSGGTWEDGEVLEIVLPCYLGSDYSNPVSDIAFSADGKMLLAERTMSSDCGGAFTTDWNGYAHSSRVLEYEYINGAWQLTPGHTAPVCSSNSHLKFRIGNFSEANSSGGIDYGYDSFDPTIPNIQPDCDRFVWTTGDLLHPWINTTYCGPPTPAWVYGMQGLPATGGDNNTSLHIDFDNDVCSHDKILNGDVEIFKCGCIQDPDFPCDSLWVTSIYIPSGSNEPEDACCWNIGLHIHDGPIDFIEVESITQGVDFQSQSLSSPFTWKNPPTSALLSIQYASGGPIPTGDYAGALQFCLGNILHPSQAPQSVVFNWYATGTGDVPYLVCTDTLALDCSPANPPCDTCAVLPPGIVAWWPMDETGFEASVNDIINHFPGASLPGLIGSGGSEPVVGKVDVMNTTKGALEFVGPNPGSHLNASNPAAFNFGHGAFSIDAWIRTDMPTQTAPIVDKLANQASGYAFAITGTPALAFPTLALGTSSGVEVFQGPPITVGQWNFVGVAVDPPIVNIYVGGDPGCNSPFAWSSHTITGVPNASNNLPLLIGKNPLNPHWQIVIDELEIFNRAISETEMRGIWSADNLGKCDPFEDCTCGNIFDMYIQSQPISCGGNTVTIGCPQFGNKYAYVLAGKFDCIGNCPPLQTINWTLTGPNGVNSGYVKKANSPYFAIGLSPLYFTQNGVYTLSLTGQCGNKTCSTCVVQFNVSCPVLCPCDTEDFFTDLNKGFSTVLWNNSCKACFSPNDLTDCDQVEWFVNGISVGMGTGTQTFCHDFQVSGTYNVEMAVTRKKSDGTTCATGTFAQNVMVSCNVIGDCGNSVFRNPRFSEGAMAGALNDGDGRSEGWTTSWGAPIVVEGEPGSADGWTIQLTGNADTSDVLSTVDSVCLAKSSGTLQVRFAIKEKGVNPNMKIQLYREDEFALSDSANWNPIRCLRLAAVDLEPLELGWYELQIPYDLSDWIAFDDCGSAPFVLVRPAVYIDNALKSLQGGIETLSIVHIDNFCFDGTIVAVQAPLRSRPLRLYPNPHPGTFTLELPEPATPGMRIRMVNLTGQTVLEKPAEAGAAKQLLNAGYLPAGMYFVQVWQEGRVVGMEKVVKQ